ncbi:MAG: ATP-binding cassette domain-containing protein [Mogibacterium sp.]|nr:ATP-binding cassette domain-containing protein [Mogibacterium sp.]
MLISGKKARECKQRILELIDKVGLTEYRNTKASRLSGGQKQRVAIARALAKDAPIIVADEPTGNLDSASAMSVMETLSKVAKDKLVVIVTHNYDQAEPYVTRKLTMHDGKIIEDKKIRRQSDEDASGEGDAASIDIISDEDILAGTDARSMRLGSELKLGIRNTFNLPAKFILLFIVYLIDSTAVLSQYAATKNSLHEGDLLGSNPYFTNINSDRIIVKKSDESAFTEEDFELVSGMNNIRSVVKNDVAIDSGVSFFMDDILVEGSVYPTSEIDESMLTYGHMPESDYEIVIATDASSDAYFSLSEVGESMIGKKIKLSDMSQMQEFRFNKPVTVAGIIVDDEMPDDSEYSMYGYSTIYVSDKISDQLLISMMASSSKTQMNFGGTKVDSEMDRSVYSSPRVPKGKAYIFEDEIYYYKDEKAIGQNLGIKVHNRFFESEANYTVEQVLTDKNIKQLLDIEQSEYDMYYECVYINDQDFNKLFDKGHFQISVFMENETDSDNTLKELQSAGFTTLALKDSLTDFTGGFNVVIQMITYVRLAIELVILFFISYAVIKLIMRSRNSYYSTLRILGATKRNTDMILRVELIIMMFIAYAVDIAFVAAVKTDLIKLPAIKKMLYFVTIPDYVMLGVVLLAMSLLIANRYSRKIFTRSAMRAFREGA